MAQRCQPVRPPCKGQKFLFFDEPISTLLFACPYSSAPLGPARGRCQPFRPAPTLPQPLRCPRNRTGQNGRNGGRRLSPSTLRRFFGLVDKEGGFHLHTLDSLARYAGHANFAEFGKSVAQLAATESINSPADIPELLAMERLAPPERLLLGYFLGRVTRPAQPSPAA